MSHPTPEELAMIAGSQEKLRLSAEQDKLIEGARSRASSAAKEESRIADLPPLDGDPMTLPVPTREQVVTHLLNNGKEYEADRVQSARDLYQSNQFRRSAKALHRERLRVLEDYGVPYRGTAETKALGLDSTDGKSAETAQPRSTSRGMLDAGLESGEAALRGADYALLGGAGAQFASPMGVSSHANNVAARHVLQAAGQLGSDDELGAAHEAEHRAAQVVGGVAGGVGAMALPWARAAGGAGAGLAGLAAHTGAKVATRTATALGGGRLAGVAGLGVGGVVAGGIAEGVPVAVESAGHAVRGEEQPSIGSSLRRIGTGMAIGGLMDGAIGSLGAVGSGRLARFNAAQSGTAGPMRQAQLASDIRTGRTGDALPAADQPRAAGGVNLTGIKLDKARLMTDKAADGTNVPVDPKVGHARIMAREFSEKLSAADRQALGVMEAENVKFYGTPEGQQRVWHTDTLDGTTSYVEKATRVQRRADPELGRAFWEAVGEVDVAPRADRGAHQRTRAWSWFEARNLDKSPRIRKALRKAGYGVDTNGALYKKVRTNAESRDPGTGFMRPTPPHVPATYQRVPVTDVDLTLTPTRGNAAETDRVLTEIHQDMPKDKQSVRISFLREKEKFMLGDRDQFGADWQDIKKRHKTSLSDTARDRVRLGLGSGKSADPKDSAAMQRQTQALANKLADFGGGSPDDVLILDVARQLGIDAQWLAAQADIAARARVKGQLEIANPVVGQMRRWARGGANVAEGALTMPSRVRALNDGAGLGGNVQAAQLGTPSEERPGVAQNLEDELNKRYGSGVNGPQ